MINEEYAHSRQDAQAFIDDADSYLLMTLKDDIPHAAGYADDLDQLLMLLAYLDRNPPLKKSLRICLSDTFKIGEN
jgi:elongation factor P--beta-lysine ligase